MKSKTQKLLAAVFVIFFGTQMAAGAQEQPVKTGKGYLVIEHGVPTPEIMEPLQEYSEVSRSLLDRYEGRFIIADNESIESVEGGWEPPFFIVIEFPSYDNARAFYFSEEYQKVLPERLDVFKNSRSILIQGRAE